MNKSPDTTPYDKNGMRDFINDILRFNYDMAEGAFYKFHQQTNRSYDELPKEIKDMMEQMLMFSLQRSNGIDTRLTSNDNDTFWNNASRSISSDEIVFEKHEDYTKVSTFWMPPDYEKNGTPADLILSKTIPLPDVIISCKDFRYLNEQDEEKTMEISFRVFLYENWKEVVDDVKNNQYALGIIGGVIFDYKPDTKKSKKRKDPQAAFVICIGYETDYLLVCAIAYKNCERSFVKSLDISEIHFWNTLILNAYYGIQLAMLNPITERVFLKAREHPISERKVTVGKKQKDRKIIYTKKYYIHEDDIVKAIDNYKTHNIRCPLYYCIGHYRQLRSGKKIWINGFWKGKERHRMSNLNEQESLSMRQRIIDMRSVE